MESENKLFAQFLNGFWKDFRIEVAQRDLRRCFRKVLWACDAIKSEKEFLKEMLGRL